MQFADRTLTIESPFGPIPVRVTAHALHMLWGADVGPQDADGLIAENRSTIESVARLKFEAGEIDGDGLVQISDYDLED